MDTGVELTLPFIIVLPDRDPPKFPASCVEGEWHLASFVKVHASCHLPAPWYSMQTEIQKGIWLIVDDC